MAARWCLYLSIDLLSCWLLVSAAMYSFVSARMFINDLGGTESKSQKGMTGQRGLDDCVMLDR